MKRLIEKENLLGKRLKELDRSIGNIYYYDTVISTMDVAFTVKDSELKDKSLIVADDQTMGRGRYKRIWYSGENDLICSLLLKEYDSEVPYSIVASYAVYKSFLNYTDMVRIKWINDILWANGKKISGILTEEKNKRTVIGIGVNLNTDCFPEGLKSIATSYYIETGIRIAKDNFLVELIKNLINLLKRIEKGEISNVLLEWEDDSKIKDRKIKLVTENNEFTGITQGINAQSGALRVKVKDGIKEFYEGSMFYI